MNFPRLPSRGARWTLFVLVFAIGLGALLANLATQRALKIPPAGYIVALEDATRVRVRWKTRRIMSALTLSPNATVSVPAGKKVLLVYPDGRRETVVGPRRIQVSTPVSSDLDFLASSLDELLSKTAVTPEKPSQDAIHITSPVGLTRFLNPTIAWLPRDGTLYDVAIVDPADEAAPPRLLKGVRPPVKVSALQSTQGTELPADRIFGVIVRQTDNSNILGVNRFLTSAAATAEELPTTPPELMTEAIAALAQKPTRTGDAWLALSHLPEPWKQSELGIRLRLKVAGELGLTDEIAPLVAELRQVAK